ncbi:ATP-binding cassette domain-containing protein [uncultured Treponema sp.]|uniref:ATP-binding cassette domain-containing protein n=1 Tax=uncultured Treponema sp. TaxID=162155 RepID=UPI0026252540|nr:ATP-binding cassette domain-containing protein [uncultured Treponema sp.]
MNKKKVFVFSVAFFFLLWKFFSLAIDSPLILPSPESVAADFFSLASEKIFLKSLAFTLFRVFCAFFISSFFGILFGFLCTKFYALKILFEIPLAFVRSVPLVSVILIVLFWLGSDSVPVFAAVLLSFPVMFTSAFSGFSFKDKKKESVCNIFKITEMQKFLFLKIPYAKEFLKDAMENSCGMIWKAIAAAEVLSVPKFALGSQLQNFQVVLEISKVFAVTIFIVLLGFLSEKILLLFFFALKKIYKNFINFYFQSDFFKLPQLSLEKKFSVELKNFYVEHDGKFIFKNYSETFEQKKITSIVAPSGSGKTTLLDFVAENFSSVSYSMQTPNLFLNLSVFQNVQLPLLNIYGRKKSFEIAKNILNSFGLNEKEKSCVEKISGGERQRVSLARAVAFPSGILLLDESFQFLDFSIKKKCIEFILNRQKENPRTIIFAANEIKEAVLFSDKIIFYSSSPMLPLKTFFVSSEDKKTPAALEKEILALLLSL